MATLKRPKIDFQNQLLLNAGQKYWRMHSAILLTFINSFAAKFLGKHTYQCQIYFG